MSKETYYIRIEVRDSNGKPVIDKNGNNRVAVQAELSFDTDGKYLDGIKGALKSHMTEMGKTVEAWVPEGSKVSVEASVKHGVDKFSQTFMTMHSYYVDENRFISH